MDLVRSTGAKGLATCIGRATYCFFGCSPRATRVSLRCCASYSLPVAFTEKCVGHFHFRSYCRTRVLYLHVLFLFFLLSLFILVWPWYTPVFLAFPVPVHMLTRGNI